MGRQGTVGCHLFTVGWMGDRRHVDDSSVDAFAQWIASLQTSVEHPTPPHPRL